MKRILRNSQNFKLNSVLSRETVKYLRLPRWLSGKESACQCRRLGFYPWVGKIPWRRKWQLTPVFLPGRSHEQRSLAGYSPWGCKDSDTTEHIHISIVDFRKITLQKVAKFSLNFLEFSVVNV